MGQPIPRQHPAVVLRAHYTAVRSLLAAAMVAVAVLAGTVAVLATDDDAAGVGSSSHRVVPAGRTMSEQMALRRSAVHGKGSPVWPGTGWDGGPQKGPGPSR
jgi:hypothetical protein